MGLLNLSLLMSKRRRRQRRQIQTRNGRILSLSKRECSASQEDENLLGSQIKGYSGSNLPEDIWCYIHSLMPMQDAAQVACVSQAFVHSWRRHPNLHFSEGTLGLHKNACQKDGKCDFKSRVDSIIENHSGIGVKAFKLEVPLDCYHLDRLDSWLQVFVKPGFEELSLRLPLDAGYNFPCSLLSGVQLRCLSLASCQFHPAVRLDCFRSLTTLHLNLVGIMTSELGCFLSSAFSLERLELRYCSSIVRLKVPCLQRLNYLEVVCCSNLRAIESKAPNLSSVFFAGDRKVPLSLDNSHRIKTLNMKCYYCAFYARTKLPSIMPNLEALTICSFTETVNTPMVPSKFLRVKYLHLSIGGLEFDYLSLVSFLDACPSLETFILGVISHPKQECISVLNDPSDLRVIPGHHHSKLKQVKILRFCDAKSVAELTFHILECATSLECLTLDTTHGWPRCNGRTGKCMPLFKDGVLEAREGVRAAQTCIKPKVPPTVELNVLEPCSRCHDVV